MWPSRPEGGSPCRYESLRCQQKHASAPCHPCCKDTRKKQHLLLLPGRNTTQHGHICTHYSYSVTLSVACTRSQRGAKSRPHPARLPSAPPVARDDCHWERARNSARFRRRVQVVSDAPPLQTPRHPHARAAAKPCCGGSFAGSGSRSFEKLRKLEELQRFRCQRRLPPRASPSLTRACSLQLPRRRVPKLRLRLRARRLHAPPPPPLRRPRGARRRV